MIIIIQNICNYRTFQIDGNVHAEFQLESLLLEGHCYDSTSGQPPRGLQFILGTNSTQAMVDTIVMANLVNMLDSSSVNCLNCIFTPSHRAYGYKGQVRYLFVAYDLDK